jgi:hypothetical protein
MSKNKTKSEKAAQPCFCPSGWSETRPSCSSCKKVKRKRIQCNNTTLLCYKCVNDSSLIKGCTDPNAFNYDPAATCDDGSCCYISGCTKPTAANYNPAACYDDGSCINHQHTTKCEIFLNRLPELSVNTGVIQITQEVLCNLALKTKYLVCTGTVTTGSWNGNSAITFSFPVTVGGCTIGSNGYGPPPVPTIPPDACNMCCGQSWYSDSHTAGFILSDTVYNDFQRPIDVTNSESLYTIFEGSITWSGGSGVDRPGITLFNSATESGGYYTAAELNALIAPANAHVDYGLYASIGFAKDSSGNYYVVANLNSDGGYGYGGLPAGPSTQPFDGSSSGENGSQVGGTLYLKGIDGSTLGTCPLYGNVGDVTITAGPGWKKNCPCPPGWKEDKPTCCPCTRVQKKLRRCKKTGTVKKCYKCTTGGITLPTGEMWDGETFNVLDWAPGGGLLAPWSNTTGFNVYGEGTGAIQITKTQFKIFTRNARLLSVEALYSAFGGVHYKFPCTNNGSLCSTPQNIQGDIGQNYSNFDYGWSLSYNDPSQEGYVFAPVTGYNAVSHNQQSTCAGTAAALASFSGELRINSTESLVQFTDSNASSTYYTASELNALIINTGAQDVDRLCKLHSIEFFKDDSGQIYVNPRIIFGGSYYTDAMSWMTTPDVDTYVLGNINFNRWGNSKIWANNYANNLPSATGNVTILVVSKWS